jgi:sulfatase maturation enzyme AslB (radical SAM superfamily)
MNNTVCSAFWIHTNVRAGNKVYACCRYKEPVQTFTGDVAAILNSAEYNKLRNDSLNNIKNKNCSKCYYEESIGKTSMRQRFNEQYSIDVVELKNFEVGFDNICNLTCDGCWEQWSSSWWVKKNPNGIPKHGIITTDEFVNIPTTIDYIVFLGGEPLMTNRHERLLDSIENKSQVKVRYVTNGTFSLKSTTIELLKKFKHVEFVVSIDGYAELNDKVRSGSKWQNILDFIDQIVYNKFDLIVNTTIHKNNWFGLKDLKSFIDSKNLKWMTNFLTYPNNLDIGNLIEKQEVINFLQSFDFPNKEATIRHLEEKTC